MTTKLLTCLMVICAPALVLAQWTDDPMANTQITDLSGYQVQPKIAQNDSGIIYMSWFSSPPDSNNPAFSTHMQRLDTLGNELWAHNGLIISDHPTMTWTTDYDLIIDDSGCAIVVFCDLRTGFNEVHAYKISPDGDFLWGDDGVAVSDIEGEAQSPKAVLTDQGNIVFAWHAFTADPADTTVSVFLQKVSAEGELQWGDGIVIQGDALVGHRDPYLIAVENDQTLLAWAKAPKAGGSYDPGKDLYAQKLDGAGNFVWQSDTPIFEHEGEGEIAPGWAFPELDSDGAGGLFVAWTTADSSEVLHSRVQHVDGDGAILMAENGTEVSTLYPNHHGFPYLASVDESDEVFVFWAEEDFYQTEAGLYGQKLSSTGERLWSDQGIAFLELTSVDPGIPRAVREGDGDVVVFYDHYRFPLNFHSAVVAMRVDADGDYVWAEEHVDLASVDSEKWRPTAGALMQNQWIVTWSEPRDGEELEADIYAQNIRLSGHLGLGDLGADGWSVKPIIAGLSNAPDPFRDVTTIRFALPHAGLASLRVYNVSGELVDTVVNGQLPAGDHAVTWRCPEEASAVYFYRLDADHFAATGRMVVAR